MSTAHPPTVRTLEHPEVESILARNHVGRIAYARGNRIDLEPVHYVYEDGIVPETLTERDPTPYRTVLFRIAVQEVTGREARPGPGEG